MHSWDGINGIVETLRPRKEYLSQTTSSTVRPLALEHFYCAEITPTKATSNDLLNFYYNYLCKFLLY